MIHIGIVTPRMQPADLGPAKVGVGSLLNLFELLRIVLCG
jgi:hypothetical protein